VSALALPSPGYIAQQQKTHQLKKKEKWVRKIKKKRKMR
jgi:hypothetical protein